jgi:hypothetical protein
MSSDLTEIARNACRRLLRPVIRILLRLGISWKEFAEIAKLVFVEIAREDYGVHGRPTNASRVALMTGLSRREVGEIRKRLDSETPLAIEPKSRISRVLTGWHKDPEFSEGGRPRQLDEAEFHRLTHRYAGDIPDRAITKEMLDLGLMEAAADGRYRAMRRDYLRNAADADIVRHMGQALHDHGVSLAHNLNPERSEGWFEGFASNNHMPRGAAAKLNALLQQDGQAFLERVDAWMSEHELDASSGNGNRNGKEAVSRIGVGVYLFEHPQDTH